MSNNSDVEAAKGGGYDVVVNGQKVAHYDNLNDAQRNYNDRTGRSNAPAAPSVDQTYDTPNGPKTLAQITAELHGAGWNGDYTDPAAMVAAYNATANNSAATTIGSSTPSAAQKLLDAIASGNTQAIQQAIDEFNAAQAQQQSEFNATRQADQQKNYQDLATTLLSDASKLTGPADYYQYDKYAAGGRDLMDQLFGNEPRASFQAPSGTNEPLNIETLMQRLGFRQTPSAPAPVVTAPVPGGTPGYAPGASTTPSTGNAAIGADQVIANARGLGLDPGLIQAYVDGNHALPASPDTLRSWLIGNGYWDGSGVRTGKGLPAVRGDQSISTMATNNLASQAAPAGAALLASTLTPSAAAASSPVPTPFHVMRAALSLGGATPGAPPLDLTRGPSNPGTPAPAGVR